MADNHTFDIESCADLSEIDNAVNMAMKEISTRFDFKGSISKVVRADKKIELLADDDMKLKNVKDILENKLTRRNISLRFLDYQKEEHALGGNVKQEVLIKQGLSKEKAKEITTFIKESKLKVNTQIMDDKVRVSSPKIDTLQETMGLLKNKDLGIVLQFKNFR
ncbi:MAG: YajQ family cyclic di-GMP-binding protein [Candidatus Margulisbacteria bacterium]|nr:YajQ family cyclic di-GMP-binding protein [Candidatus Margulisiibacteriota bacterium]